MKNNKKGFSLILAMGIVIVISLIAYNILEYIIPFGKNVKSIENSSKAYYLANNGVEDGLYHISTRTDEVEESSKSFASNIDYKYNTYSSGVILPPAGEGNSDYDDDDRDGIVNHDWNTISQGDPIQLSIGNGYIGDLTNFKIAFRVPNLDKFDSSLESVYNPETLSGDILPIVNWQLSSENNTLNASGGIILANKVLASDKLFSDSTLDLKDLTGYDLNGNSGISIETFYGTDNSSGNCFGTNSGCILKFSVVNKLELNDKNIGVPYLEWKLDAEDIATNKNNLPLRYTKIESTGKSIGYKKELKIKVPTNTVNQAFDFTAFQ